MSSVAFGSSGNTPFRLAGSEAEDARGAQESGQRDTSANANGRSENPRDATTVFDKEAVTSSNRSSAAAERDGQSESGDAAKEKGADGEALTEEEEQRVQELKQRDREVRAHEQAHARVGGPYASAPTYTLETGPDGGRYAVAGQVKIDAAPVEGNPKASIQKLQTVIRAALAPREPSSQDRSVARQAQADLREAQAQLQAENNAKLRGEDGDDATKTQAINTQEQAAANAYSSIQNENAAQSKKGGGLFA